MTSSPLFIIVAESMEILPPIRHVGMRERGLDADVVEISEIAMQERTARGGEDDALDLVLTAAADG